VEHQRKGKAPGKLKLGGEEGVLFSLGIPEGPVIQVKAGLAYGAYPPFPGQGRKKIKESVKSAASGIRALGASA
jgi:hypothetical protein